MQAIPRCLVIRSLSLLKTVMARTFSGIIHLVNRIDRLQGELSMADTNERRAAEIGPPVPSPAPVSQGTQAGGQPEAQQSNDIPAGSEDWMVELKRRLEETCLPAESKQEILAELPPPEIRERLFRELQEQGGLSVEQFFESLGLEVKLQR
jgi:hypothetical protein